MSPDEIARLEKLAYSKGYAAGRRRLEADLRTEDAYKEKCEFHDRAFLVALPSALDTTWTRNNKPAIALADRIAVAWDVASAAVKSRRYP